MDKKTMAILLSLVALIAGIYLLTNSVDIKPFFSFQGFNQATSSASQKGFSELLGPTVTPTP
ncbi:hypothetical protein A3D77_02995 [Candidatus Gottesmanbacteria bacterium RIFCSPHIGHO2_02_FULL_39_11]|uniref:Uncharacterized protein n=1 Tax=Candidatus Gottesmanbacteria bacterium RIFCSPHIGHO2_02_FULL_39_11 TaxID=1798382 RepID=A0A1F5ZTM0_9BACT|nr:MAG: hypothetical protein A3D77_02995 [Candidatus Gottesmanbacteria bacterium RIFCSPHIGHO2_02_FULL_39_11]